MGVGTGVIVVCAILVALPSLVLLHAAIMLIRRCPQLDDVPLRERDSWPRLSVLIAARDEADTMEPALATVLAQDYPALQVVLVDDRSSDRTAEIVDRLAASDARVSAVHVRALPPGWLGKVHAQQRGLERADGELVLFTDADVHFAPGVLRRAVGWMEERRFDHLAVLADVRHRSFWAGLCAGSAMRAILVVARPWKAMDPRSAKAIGTGVFNLVRRSAFERTPGLEWLRLEVADDVGLGVMMKRFGARPGFALGRGQVIHMSYSTLAAAVRGFEKNAFAQGARFSPWRALAVIVIVAVGMFGLVAAFLPVGVPWLWTVGAIGLGAFVAASVIVGRTAVSPLWSILLSLPLGDLLMAYVVVRATVLGIRRGGLEWRGTTYPTGLLRAGQRVDV